MQQELRVLELEEVRREYETEDARGTAMSVRERYEKALTEVRRLIQEERKEKARKEVGEILKELEQIDQAALQRGLAEQREGRAEVAWEDLDGVRLGTHNDHPPGRVGTQAKKVG